MNIQLVTLDLKGLNINAAQTALLQRFILAKIENGDLKVADFQSGKAQQIIDDLANQIPDLLPVQFHHMLNKYGFDDAIAILLPTLKTEDLEKYAMYKAYLEQSRFYEFEKTLVMFNDIKAKVIAVDESLDFTLEQLKNMWKEASNI